MAGKGQGGRKPKPQPLKVIQGTARKDRVNKLAPDMPTGVPGEPSMLPEGARKYYADLIAILEPLKLLYSAHPHMLGMLAMRLNEIDELTRIITEEGPIYDSEKWTRDDDGVMHRTLLKKSHPAVNQRSEAMRHAQSLLAEFGLSPAAVSKVTALNNSESNNPFAAFVGGSR
ncbi:P27 family phage terminase small subunit [Oleidesulfovibrio sp.]|uniref:P27 family phage terminase small subunit n=1 Tax=Oleidesulfovibrio sp. TaxID=2909707 RepID=UPI003A8510A9